VRSNLSLRQVPAGLRVTLPLKLGQPNTFIENWFV